jgi:DNA-directed RNA polymerase subunit K/omega
MAVVDDVERVLAFLDDKDTARCSNNILTKYEFNQMISLRTMHLCKGAPPLVDLPKDYKVKGNMELRSIALQELRANRLPYIIRRSMPNGKTEYTRLADMDLTGVRHLIRDA